MKREIATAIAALVAACLLCNLSWMGFMTFLRSRVTPVTVAVDGSVDSVSIYDVSDPGQAVTTITTNGQDTIADFELPAAREGFALIQPAAAQYYFVTNTGGQRQQGPVFCCVVNIFPEHRVLTIGGPSAWEVHSE